MLTPFAPASVPPDRQLPSYWTAKGLSEADAQVAADEMARSTWFRNNVYQVCMRDCGDPPAGWPRMIHLSIRRNDRRLVRDWRQLQWIKNQLVGPDHEAVELFPADARLVDTADQYHLWVLAEAGVRFPFGFEDRLVDNGPAGGLDVGQTQRPHAVAP